MSRPRPKPGTGATSASWQKTVLAWLDDRTGLRGALRKLLIEPIPGGARWRYVWGSTLTFAIAVQFVTGIVLWAAYSPNAQGAWESVYYVQNVMAGGNLLRGIHHYMAHATVVLLVLHLMQVVVHGAYKAPREVNFWFGLALLHIVMGLLLTGYLLPWDQKGYWATKVATSIASLAPVIGPGLQDVLVGGADYGHLTLTRFFALHAGVLPALLVVLVVAHVYLFRRHGVTTPEPRDEPSQHDEPSRRDGVFWPDQLLRDAVACLAVMVAVLFLVSRTGGAPLGAPADPSEPYAAARPEWYFMFLFQWLKYFPAGTEVLGAIVIPGAVVALAAAMPLLGRWRLGHGFNVGLAITALAVAGLLTWRAYAEDGSDPDFRFAQARAKAEAERVAELAVGPDGIPPSGALTLLRSDPLTQGPRLFADRCASCHTHGGTNGLGREPVDPPTAPDLKRFASREWLAGLLDPERVATTEYFGGTAFARGRMVRMVQSRIARFDATQAAELGKVVKALSAQAALAYQASADSADRAEIVEGAALISSESMGCTECHEFRGTVETPRGPALTGYGSREWLTAVVADPEHPAFYGERNDRMPSFGRDEILSPDEIGMLVDWLREEWYRVPATGQPDDATGQPEDGGS